MSGFPPLPADNLPPKAQQQGLPFNYYGA